MYGNHEMLMTLNFEKAERIRIPYFKEKGDD